MYRDGRRSHRAGGVPEKVPFVIVRAISDKADDSATMDYPTFEAQAIEHSVKLVEDFVSRIPEDVY